MQRWLLKSKLHRACVTATEKDYEGSIAIDTELLSAADILPGERVQVLDIANGARFETYTIEGEAGQIAVNGAAARLVEPGDRVIVVSYGLYDEDEQPEPTVLLLDAENQITDRA